MLPNGQYNLNTIDRGLLVDRFQSVTIPALVKAQVRKGEVCKLVGGQMQPASITDTITTVSTTDVSASSNTISQRGTSMAAVDDKTFVAISSGGGITNVRVGSCSDLGVINMGALTSLGVSGLGDDYSIVKVSKNKFVAAVFDNSDDCYVVAFTVDPVALTVSVGTAVLITSGSTQLFVNIDCIDEDKFVVAYGTAATNFSHRVGTVSGTTITIGSATNLSSAVFNKGLIAAGKNRFYVLYRNSGTSQIAYAVYSVSGTTATNLSEAPANNFNEFAYHPILIKSGVYGYFQTTAVSLSDTVRIAVIKDYNSSRPITYNSLTSIGEYMNTFLQRTSNVTDTRLNATRMYKLSDEYYLLTIAFNDTDLRMSIFRKDGSDSFIQLDPTAIASLTSYVTMSAVKQSVCALSPNKVLCLYDSGSTTLNIRVFSISYTAPAAVSLGDYNPGSRGDFLVSGKLPAGFGMLPSQFSVGADYYTNRFNEFTSIPDGWTNYVGSALDEYNIYINPNKVN
jgi:hypothetical protein